MKAAILSDYNQSYQIESVKSPIGLGPNDVRIKMRFSSYNPVDNQIKQGFVKAVLPMHQFQDDDSDGKYMILGTDFLGEVMETGSKVSSVSKGDIVCGSHKYGRKHKGTFAEEAIVKDSEVCPVPEGVHWELAACMGVAGMTAFQALQNIAHDKEGTRDILKGKSIVMIGASGGVGSFTVLLAKHFFGAYVYAVCSSDHADYVKQLGADEVIDYKKTSMEEYMKNKSSEDQDRLWGIIDGFGSDEYRHQGMRLLGKNSDKTYVSVALPHNKDSWKVGDDLELAAEQFLTAALSKLGATCRVKAILMQVDPQMLKKVLLFLKEEKLQDKVQRKVYSLDEIQEVDNKSMEGHTCGKMVIQIDNEKQ